MHACLEGLERICGGAEGGKGVFYGSLELGCIIMVGGGGCCAELDLIFCPALQSRESTICMFSTKRTPLAVN